MPLPPPPARLIAVSAMFGTLFLAGCVAVVDSRPRPPGPGLPDGGPQICTREYQPVCASRGRDERTFGNRCEARAAGYRIEHRGRCRGGSDRPDRPDRPGAGRPDRPQICTMEYAPVCARKDGRNRTYANACHARGEDARIVRRGAC